MSALARQLVHPMMGYYLCKHYVGNEPNEQDWLDLPPPDAKELTLARLKTLQKGDLVYLQVDFLHDFATQYLPALPASIFLMTGQYLFPSISDSPDFTAILTSERILHWFVQNPFTQHPKLTGIPYGLHHYDLKRYAAVLILANPEVKQKMLTVPQFSPEHHFTRPPIKSACKSGNHTRCVLVRSTIEQYLHGVERSNMIISPVGDRPDTYRHWEAIGLGVVPICNCPKSFDKMFGHNMLFMETDDTAHVLALSDRVLKSMYREPDQRLIFIDYWRNVISNVTQAALKERV